MLGAVRLIKNADIDRYKHTGYGIGFDRRGPFTLANGSGENVMIFGVDMSSSVHVDKKKKNILILGEAPTQELDDKTLTVENKTLVTLNKNFV